MNSSTYMPGDLVMIKQDTWITIKNTWNLTLTSKSHKGIFLGEYDRHSCPKGRDDEYFAHPYPVRVMIDGDKEIIVNLSKINYYTKRRSYEKVN